MQKNAVRESVSINNRNLGIVESNDVPTIHDKVTETYPLETQETVIAILRLALSRTIRKKLVFRVTSARAPNIILSPVNIG